MGREDLDEICTSDCKVGTSSSWRQLAFSASPSSPHANSGVITGFSTQMAKLKVILAVVAPEDPQYVIYTAQSQSYAQTPHPYFR